MPQPAYQRVVLKLSGEFLSAGRGGIDFERTGRLAEELAEARALGCQLALVVGGGNLFRGRDAQSAGLERVRADRIGMAATVLNALALGGVLSARGLPVSVFSATPMAPLALPYSAEAAREALDRGEVVLAAGGIGDPYFSTDSAAALRALELKAGALLKGTKVDGVYEADPVANPGARRFDAISYDEALARDLRVLDGTALALCRDGDMPLLVFDFSQRGNLVRILKGEALGTRVFQEVKDD